MNKITTLIDSIIAVIDNVNTLADNLQGVANALTKFKHAEVIQEPAAQIPQKITKPKKEKSKVYTLEEVRGVLAEKSQNGLTKEVKDLITKFGGSKLSDIEPSKYEEIIKEAEVLGNE